MKYITGLVAAIAGLAVIGFLGLLVKPSQFATPAPSVSPQPARLVPIPAGLPAPVDRWYRSEYPAGLPVYDSIVMRGTGTMRIAGIPLPFRHLVEVRPGRGFYRKMDITWFNLAVLHGLDTFVDGTGVMNTPVGRVDGPKIDQGASIVAWLEVLAAPGVLAENHRVRWEAIDNDSARMVVPFKDGEDSVVIAFDAATGDPVSARTYRYREADSAERTGWVATMSARRQLPGGMGRLATKMDAKWDNDAKPWATFEYEAAWPNAEVPGFDAAANDGGMRIGDAR